MERINLFLGKYTLAHKYSGGENKLILWMRSIHDDKIRKRKNMYYKGKHSCEDKNEINRYSGSS